MKRDLRAGFSVAILRRRIKAHQIAGHQLEILQPQRVRAVGIFRARRLQQAHVAVRAAVHRVVQMHIVQPELSAAFTPTVTSSIGLAR